LLIFKNRLREMLEGRRRKEEEGGGRRKGSDLISDPIHL